MKDNQQYIEQLLNNLNQNQKEAVIHTQGASLVIAGAGAGKTRVLTYKIAYLILNGIKPYNILALTFTNKAAREMKERINQLINDYTETRQLYMGTFHSIFYRILRAEAEYINYESNFTIYDQTDSKSLIKTILKTFGLNDKIYKPNTVQNLISNAKNHLIDSYQYSIDTNIKEKNNTMKMPAMAQIYTAYQNQLKQANAMDFDDLLLNMYILLKQNKNIKDKYAATFKYILVDEYQDTNYAQVEILKLLVNDEFNICAVGDDYQSIYSFRGANINNILSFQSTFPNTKLFKLERNYRSTKKIVKAANSLMKHNKTQIEKDVYSEESDGLKIKYLPCYNDKEEAITVVKQISKLKIQENLKYSDFAILYRTNAQSRSFEDELRRMKILYHIYGGISFYQRKEIKDTIAYFRLVANHNDDEALKRIINYPTRGIGQTTILKLIQAATNNNTSIWNVINNIESLQVDISKSTLNKLRNFQNLITGFIQQLPKNNAYDLGVEIIKSSGIAHEINQGKELEDIVRQENLEELINSLQIFLSEQEEQGEENNIYLTDYIQKVALYTESDRKTNNEPKVSLMTIHAAKGLEFPIVFIVGLEENIFPAPMIHNNPKEIEEERRLLYVAITRAEKQCFLTNAKNRYKYGNIQFNNPSRFLRDIDPKYLDYNPQTFNPKPQNKSFFSSFQNSKPVAFQFKADRQPKITNCSKCPTQEPKAVTSYKGIKQGTIIEHQRFGIGTVEYIEGEGENTKATVNFKNVGKKTLLLKFAKYSIIS